MPSYGVSMPHDLTDDIEQAVDERPDIDDRSDAIRRWTALGKAVDDVFEDHNISHLNERGRRMAARQALVEWLNDEFDLELPLPDEP